MRTGWMVATAGLAALFAIFLLQSARLPLGDELGPGPGFFPLAISVVGLLLAGTLFVTLWRTESAIGESSSGFSGLRRVGLVLAVVALAATVIEQLGYTLTTLMLVPAVLVILGARSKVAISIVTLAMSFGVFHIFYYWLNVALPVGLVGI